MWRVVLLSCGILAFAVPGFAETYVVNPDGTGDFPTIQAAVHASHDGDIIELADGVFAGLGNRDIDYMGKAITIRSRSGVPYSCIIDCQGTPSEPHRGFIFERMESPASILEGVTITNGYAWRGGGIYLEAAFPTIIRCVLLRNTGHHGGGMDCDLVSGPTLVQCTFVENSATFGGGMCI